MNIQTLAISAFALLLSPSAFSNTVSSQDEFFENSSGSPILSLIQGAKQSIDLETYTMNDPKVDEALRSAATRGVRVNVVEESSPVGATCHPFGGSTSPSSQTPECLRQQDLVNFINKNGGTYTPFSKSLCGKPGSRCYQHGKIAIIDGKAALISTGNFDVTSLCDIASGAKNCDRDYSILTSDGAVISSISSVFNHDLKGSPSDLNNLGSPRLTVSPDSMKPIVDFITSARSTLQIETQYLQDPTMNQAIVDAANRGVKVSVMVSSACSFGKPTASVVKKWTATYTAFDSAGINTRIFDAKMKVGGIKGYLHAKAIIVDGVHAWLGSVNGSTTALSDNREYGLFIDDGALISKLNQFVTSDFANPLAESWQDSIVCQ